MVGIPHVTSKHAIKIYIINYNIEIILQKFLGINQTIHPHSFIPPNHPQNESSNRKCEEQTCNKDKHNSLYNITTTKHEFLRKIQWIHPNSIHST